ncbi:NAD(P)/FAD-dependent oxidoreductase [Legionella sp. PC997]|uniref:flavin-containing monooxygenase n=1 Tax=Legionella sp. PC997 TaxID=2755562 RepID=UPI0015FA8FCF|nr:NAD(P)-binding domain-containing protein [Legionella sp. PC997]QMT59102.1 monooxygenase [Legionella sp. PC997]
MHKIAIIGAGASGLTSAVAALDEGIVPTLFEMSFRVGGVWGPDDRKPSDQGSAWPGMKVNISRHTGTFSNFNWPTDTADFPTTQEVYDYLSNYTKHFNLLPYIRFGCRVIEVLEQDGKWLIRWQENKTTLKEELFDSLIIATSKFTNPYIPKFKGLDQLQDNMLHSSKYKSAKEFVNKRVLILGGSLSGTSLAEEVAKITEVTHLLRKERWVIKRYRSSDPQNDGPVLPRDLLKTYASSQKPMSREEQYQFMLQHCSEQNEVPEWHMSPNSPVGFVVADDYFKEVRCGKLKPICGEVDYFLNSSVVLKDGRTLEFDVVIFCTGYERDLSFLPEHLRLPPTSLLYEDTFSLATHRLAYIGMYPGARGAVFPLVELQARYACGVFSGRLKLPPIETMKEEAAHTSKDRDELEFSTALAEKLGITPNLNSYNWGLRHMLLNGAYTPARFRLEGLHSNPKAALKSIEETALYRHTLLKAHDKVPSLVSLCLFQLNKQKKEEKQGMETFSLSNTL